MEWHNPKDKLPTNNSLVIIWYGTDVRFLDSRYDRNLYNLYKIAHYFDGCWWDAEEPGKEIDTSRYGMFIYAWSEFSRVPEEIEMTEKLKEVEDEERINDRFEILNFGEL